MRNVVIGIVFKQMELEQVSHTWCMESHEQGWSGVTTSPRNLDVRKLASDVQPGCYV
jgi:hypothetical protein